MVNVHAVADAPEVAQRGPAQHPREARARRERADEKPAEEKRHRQDVGQLVVQPVVGRGPAALPPPDELRQRQHRRTPPQRRARVRKRDPVSIKTPVGQQRAEAQRERRSAHRQRREQLPRNAARRAQQHHRRRADEHRADHSAEPRARHRQHHQRPHEIELLLDRQRPKMRRVFEIQPAENLREIRGVGEMPPHPGAHRRRADEAQHRDAPVVNRRDAQRAPDVETPQRAARAQSPGAHAFLRRKKDRADEVAADDEKDDHARGAEVQPGVGRRVVREKMREQHHRRGHRAPAVDARFVARRAARRQGERRGLFRHAHARRLRIQRGHSRRPAQTANTAMSPRMSVNCGSHSAPAGVTKNCVKSGGPASPPGPSGTTRTP